MSTAKPHSPDFLQTFFRLVAERLKQSGQRYLLLYGQFAQNEETAS